MPEQATIAIRQEPVDTMMEFFGYAAKKAIPFDALRSFVKLASVFTSHKIDPETARAIAQSFEDRHGKLDDSYLRLTKFQKFIEDLSATMPERNAFIDQVKNLGLLGKPALEEYAKETGDWSHFLKRSEHDSKVDVAPRPEAKV